MVHRRYRDNAKIEKGWETEGKELEFGGVFMLDVFIVVSLVIITVFWIRLSCFSMILLDFPRDLSTSYIHFKEPVCIQKYLCEGQSTSDAHENPTPEL